MTQEQYDQMKAELDVIIASPGMSQIESLAQILEAVLGTVTPTPAEPGT